MTLRFARVSLGKDLKVHTRNYAVSCWGRRKCPVHHQPSVPRPSHLPAPHPHFSCAVEWGGGWIKEALPLLTSPSRNRETLRGVGRESPSYFPGAVVSPFEALVGARRLLGPREPADGLQRRARPPGLPRPLASSLSPRLLPFKIHRRSCYGSRRAPRAS